MTGIVARFHLQANGGARMNWRTQSAIRNAGSFVPLKVSGALRMKFCVKLIVRRRVLVQLGVVFDKDHLMTKWGSILDRFEQLPIGGSFTVEGNKRFASQLHSMIAVSRKTSPWHVSVRQAGCGREETLWKVTKGERWSGRWAEPF